jgi:hypothetical protein
MLKKHTCTRALTHTHTHWFVWSSWLQKKVQVICSETSVALISNGDPSENSLSYKPQIQFSRTFLISIAKGSLAWMLYILYTGCAKRNDNAEEMTLCLADHTSYFQNNCKDSYLTVALNVRLLITPTEHEAKIESIRFCKNGLQNKKGTKYSSLRSKTLRWTIVRQDYVK